MTQFETISEILTRFFAGTIGQATLAALKVLLILLLGKIVLSVGSTVIRRTFCPDSRGLNFEAKKAKTLQPLMLSLLRYTVYFLVAATILDTLRIVSTATILASAGVFGLAIGFGAQSLVKDVITGFFILFEDQFAVGEYVDAAGLSGTVEELGLRVTKIRDFSGALHVIPNGSITNVTNYDRGNMRALVKVAVAYKENTEKVMAVLEQAMLELREENPAITDGPRVLGMSELLDSGVEFLLWARSSPGAQWELARQMRRKAKAALDAAGIEIPFPHRVVFNRTED